MNRLWIFILLFVPILFSSCQEAEPVPAPPPVKPRPQPVAKKFEWPVLPGFTNIKSIAPSIVLDIRYATKNNFTGSKIYPCASCYLRPEVARALAGVNDSLRKQGIGIKVFDCYRPLPAQQKLWNKMPVRGYVAPPSHGSMHNRGMAVDLTLFDISKMRELYMGTRYDYFGPKAHTNYPGLSPKVKKNRELLRRAMEAAGFKGIRSEWWHYNYTGPKAPLDSVEWKCPE